MTRPEKSPTGIAGIEPKSARSHLNRFTTELHLVKGNPRYSLRSRTHTHTPDQQDTQSVYSPAGVRCWERELNNILSKNSKVDVPPWDGRNELWSPRHLDNLRRLLRDEVKLARAFPISVSHHEIKLRRKLMQFDHFEASNGLANASFKEQRTGRNAVGHSCKWWTLACLNRFTLVSKSLELISRFLFLTNFVFFFSVFISFQFNKSLVSPGQIYLWCQK